MSNMKIIGLISDENELDDLEYIAKIVMYEQRMKTFRHNPSFPTNKTYDFKKISPQKIIHYPFKKQIKVRGFM